MNFSNIKDHTKKELEKLINHPFMVELYSGELSFDKFIFFLKQDFYYLEQSMKNMGILLAKAEDLTARRMLINILYNESEIEFKNYLNLLESLNIDPSTLKSIDLTRANIAYSNYLISQSAQKSFVVGMAALLPCYYSYLEIYQYHKDKLSNNENDIYLKWASTYDEAKYKKLVGDLIYIFELYLNSEKEEEITQAYKNSLKFEYEFLEDAYYQKIWRL
ncbi:thiaminase II/PqqC family protein [Petrotoga sp. DB-2]|jgi:thiaminase/transcriptional activator TenA